MITVDRRSRVPVYEQIENEIMMRINIGSLSPNEKLPSIRQVASETGININTVKKAFFELENAGVIYTVAGTGSFVSEDALSSELMRKSVFDDIYNAVNSAKARGITCEEIITYIKKAYRGEIKNDNH